MERGNRHAARESGSVVFCGRESPGRIVGEGRPQAARGRNQLPKASKRQSWMLVQRSTAAGVGWLAAGAGRDSATWS